MLTDGLFLVGWGKAESRAGKVPRDYVTKESVVVGNEGRFELGLSIGEVGKGSGGHWSGDGFLVRRSV